MATEVMRATGAGATRAGKARAGATPASDARPVGAQTGAEIGARTGAPAAAPILALAVMVLLAAAGGYLLTLDAASLRAAQAAGPELARLLRAMAVLKAALAAAAVWLVGWRLAWPVGPRLAVVYIIAAGLMAAAPGVMWHLAHVIAGGVLFHVGLAVLIVLACTDRATGRDMLMAAVRRRRGQAAGRV